MNTLILFAHPAFHKSHVNKELMLGIEKIPNVTFHDLYEEYPDFDIDVEKEQELLSQHDCIVFHFPLFWYSTPALLKEWQDLVLKHGWAFGSKGNALKDKIFFTTVTAGGPELTYRKNDLHNHTLDEMLLPITQTAKLCKMRQIPPFVVYGTHVIEKHEILQQKRVYIELLRQLANNEIDVEQAATFKNLNEYITHKSI